jgi:hypothetical protein
VSSELPRKARALLIPVPTALGQSGRSDPAQAPEDSMNSMEIGPWRAFLAFRDREGGISSTERALPLSRRPRCCAVARWKARRSVRWTCSCVRRKPYSLPPGLWLGVHSRAAQPPNHQTRIHVARHAACLPLPPVFARLTSVSLDHRLRRQSGHGCRRHRGPVSSDRWNCVHGAHPRRG